MNSLKYLFAVICLSFIFISPRANAGGYYILIWEKGTEGQVLTGDEESFTEEIFVGRSTSGACLGVCERTQAYVMTKYPGELSKAFPLMELSDSEINELRMLAESIRVHELGTANRSISVLPSCSSSDSEQTWTFTPLTYSIIDQRTLSPDCTHTQIVDWDALKMQDWVKKLKRIAKMKGLIK